MLFMPRRVTLRLLCLLVLISCVGFSPVLAGELSSDVQQHWIDPAGISGSLVIAGGGSLPDSIYKSFLELAGGENAKLVIVPTASESADKADEETLANRWTERGFPSVKVLHTRDRKVASDAEFLAPLKEATAVWFEGGQQSRIADAYQGTAFESELKNLLKRGGVIGGTSAGAAIPSKIMIASGKNEPNIQTGLDLLPGAIIDQHFTQRNRHPRLRLAVKEHPQCVGFGIDEGTALIVGMKGGRMSPADRGRTIRVVGSGEVTVMLAASDTKPMKEYRVKENGMLDLVQLQRAARDRSGNFPASACDVPCVPKGALVIIGGGGMPRDVVAKIIELSGGPEAKIVALSTGHTPEAAAKEGPPSYFVRAGAKNITVIHARGPEDCAKPEVLKALQEADCVWFGGGRQWRFVDAYDGTPMIELFHDVLKRGGVICGSSAGASIQGEYLARADALTNRPIMAEGYERGFNFLPGTAIDQHFAQRNRFGDLRSLVATYPQYLGIGIDEATAIIVQGEVAEVMGRNKVHFFDVNLKRPNGTIPQISLSAGASFHLPKRFVLNPAVAEKPPL